MLPGLYRCAWPAAAATVVTSGHGPHVDRRPKPNPFDAAAGSCAHRQHSRELPRTVHPAGPALLGCALPGWVAHERLPGCAGPTGQPGSSHVGRFSVLLRSVKRAEVNACDRVSAVGCVQDDGTEEHAKKNECTRDATGGSAARQPCVTGARLMMMYTMF
jgi:hypothetical protein